MVAEILDISGCPHGQSGRSEDRWDTSITWGQNGLAKMSLTVWGKQRSFVRSSWEMDVHCTSLVWNLKNLQNSYLYLDGVPLKRRFFLHFIAKFSLHREHLFNVILNELWFEYDLIVENKKAPLERETCSFALNLLSFLIWLYSLLTAKILHTSTKVQIKSKLSNCNRTTTTLNSSFSQV